MFRLEHLSSGRSKPLTTTCSAGHDSSVGIAIRYGLDGPGSNLLIPVAERSKARVCRRSLAGVAGSYPAEGMDICVVL